MEVKPDFVEIGGYALSTTMLWELARLAIKREAERRRDEGCKSSRSS